ncbi:hypothetical protein HAX54_049444 [Datura stramonium]|uniref:WIF domain-containing protein n=1 Tax=Datura stramonium TaxID=4076 RepID=A0ABS8WN98_DATST|nr:hypothetical protein [Datura stramonium]
MEFENPTSIVGVRGLLGKTMSIFDVLYRCSGSFMAILILYGGLDPTMSDCSSSHTFDYVRFMTIPCQFRHNEQVAGLLHERHFIMQDMVEKALEFFPRLQAHVELREELDRDKRKRRAQDKLFIRMWNGIKKVLNALSSVSKMPQVGREDISEFCFLGEFEDEVIDDLSSGSFEAFS